MSSVGLKHLRRGGCHGDFRGQRYSSSLRPTRGPGLLENLGDGSDGGGSDDDAERVLASGQSLGNSPIRTATLFR